VDESFISRHTEGWAELQTLLQDYPPERVAEITGLRETEIRLAAQWLGKASEFTTFWTMGLNQSTHGTWQTNAICNLHLATGKICRPGSGPFSLTGQPNAMGGREVGYLSHTLPGQRSVTSAEDRAFVEKIWGVADGTISPTPGLDAVALFKKMEAGEVKAVWIIGTNPVASMPNRSRVIAGLERAELVIVQDAFHPTETSRYADILLPGALWAEAEGTMVNSERNVTFMPRAVAPPGEARADWQLVAQVAQHMGFGEHFNYAHASDVFDEIRQTANPQSGYDLRGISYPRLQEQSQQWPCAPDAETGNAIRYVTPDNSLKFPTDSGKAKLLARPFLPPAEAPDAEFPFVLTNGRLAHQWHTLTKTGKVASLNKLNPGAFLELHPDDAVQLGIENESLVKVSSRRGFAIYPAVVTTRVRPGDCFAPIHWNDEFGKNLCVNATTTEAMDAISLQPEFKFSAVALSKVTLEIPAEFSTHQKNYLLGLLAEVNSRGRGIPENAPFTAEQRKFIRRSLARGGP
jgi:sulfite reductase (NADPH) flavoprotein alpha-component